MIRTIHMKFQGCDSCLTKLLPAFLLVIAVATPAQAGIITYTDQASFLEAIEPGYYLETFDDLPFGNLSEPSRIFSSNGFSYTASAPTGNLYSGIADPNSQADQFLSTTNFSDLQFDFTDGQTTAVGGYFFPTDSGGTPTLATIRATLDDGTLLEEVTDSPTNFFGFTSMSSISSLTITTDNDLPYATANDFIVGRLSTVPEPTSMALWGLSSLGIVFACRRQRKQAERSA